jgi:hypothetical protein
MGLGWDSVLKLAAFGAFVMIALQVIFYFIFQNIGYDSYWLSITLTISILAFIILRIIWRFTTNKFPF